jgi:cold shock CspA family protein
MKEINKKNDQTFEGEIRVLANGNGHGVISLHNMGPEERKTVHFDKYHLASDTVMVELIKGTRVKLHIVNDEKGPYATEVTKI